MNTVNTGLLQNYIENLCAQAFTKAFPELSPICPEVTLSTKEDFGHFQCNEAMKCARILRKAPVQIAQEVLKHFPLEPFSSVEVAGAGFINMTLSPDFLIKKLENIPGWLTPGALSSHKQKVIVEYSSPNIAKDMHVGHLRSTIIGDCLANLYDFMGHDVLRLNHIGDWGTGFGMLIAYIQESQENYESIEDLTTLYQKSRKRFEEDDSFKTLSRQNVVLLQSGSPEITRIWQNICKASSNSFNQIYSLLGVSIQERGESFYNPFLLETVRDLEKKGLVTLSEGAKCVFHAQYPIPLMVQKSDGGFNYDTTDIAAMRYRITEDQVDKIIVVTDSGQSLHFNLVKETALAAGYLPSSEAFTHVGFGLVLDAQGKKFKTRSGESVKLMDLLTTAIDKALNSLTERHPDINPKDAKEKSIVLGINAIKYADLSCHRVSDYVFSFDKMLRFEGNTAMFILYSYVRIQGIKRKLAISHLSLTYPQTATFIHKSEKDLAFKLLCFPEVILKATKDLYPHFLTDYVFDLAEKFNAFFRDCRIEGSDQQEFRLYLCALTEAVLQLFMKLLGLKTLDTL